MSLTRSEWIEMWRAIESIEIHRIKHLPPKIADIYLIKSLIQQVIGQIE